MARHAAFPLFFCETATFPYLFNEDELEHDLMVVVVEREPPAHHLVHDDAHAPPVHGAPVVAVLEHLKRERMERHRNRVKCQLFGL